MGDLDAGGRELTGEIGALHSRVTKLEQVSHELVNRKNVDEELDLAWHEWESTFDAAKDSIVLTDSEFKIVQANRATSQLFGKSLDEIIGKTCWQLIHGTDYPPRDCPLEKAKTTKKHEEIELHLPQKDIWVTASVDPVFDQQGNLSGAVHIIKDITENKKAGDARLSLETELKDILDNTPVGIYRTTPDGRILLANPALVRMLGYSSFEEIAVRNLEEDGFEPQYSRSIFKERVEKDGQVVGLESNWIRRDGTIAAIVETAWVVRDKQGRTLYYEGIVQDITERKHAERLLRKERDRAQKYLDVAGVMLVAIDTEQRVGLINKKGCEILGYNEDEIVAKNWFDNFLPKRIKEEVKGVFNKLLCGETDAPEYYENLILTKNGDQRLIAWHNTVLRDDKGKVIAALGSGEDITERRRAEEALRESEEKYRGLVENSPNLVAIYQEGTLKYVNQIMCEKLGWTFQEMTSPSFNPVEKIIPQRFQSLIRENIAKRLRRENISPYEVSIKTRDGSEIPVIVNAQAILYHGKPADEVIHIDIAERKKAEEALHESEEKYRDLFENAREAILTLDLKGNITGVNKLVEEYGFKREDLIGKSHFDFIAEKSRDKAFKEFERLTQGTPVEGEVEVITPKGNRIVEYRNNPIRCGGQIVGVQEILIDITERKKAEQQLLNDQAQLKSLASQLTLAEEHERRRLAIELHDRISQSLVISKIKLEALRKTGRSRKLDKALEEVCDSIGQTIQDTRTLTFDLSSPVLYELGFETAVSEWLADQIQKKHGIAVEFEDDGEPKPLDDDVRVLLFRDVRELLINIVKHAHAHKVKVSVRKLDSHICVTVEDDGVGFDPADVISMAAKRGEFGFFSIRERLENLGGHLQIDSAPGRGCKVTMTAPLKQKEMTR
jgi:PAS domain S-box-containing protein